VGGTAGTSGGTAGTIGGTAGTTGGTAGTSGGTAGTTGGTAGTTGGTAGTIGTGGRGGRGGATGTAGRGGTTGGTAGTTGGTAGTTGGTAGTTGGTAGTVGSGGSGTVGGVENSGSSCTVSAANLLSAENKKLPNPFAMHDGTIISTKAQWECRRNEIKADLEKYEIGPKQAPPTVTATFSGGALTVNVTVGSNTIQLKSTVMGSGSCVVIGMNATTGLVSGCTQIPYMHDQVVGYNNGGSTQSMSDPFYKLYPSLYGKIGNYSAWAWGISRIIDGLDQVKTQMNIDMTKIATWGCSYAGKMSLFGGALDERVALTIVEESGGGGVDSWRGSADFDTRTGMSTEKIDNTNYAWFMSSMRSLDPYKLPHDHHELIAMIAPRATIILGNPPYVWLGDESGYKSTMAALQVFTAMGVADHIGYDFTGGHPHCSAPSSQMQSVTTFVNRFLKGTSSTSSVAIPPTDGTSFDTNWMGEIDWTAPTLQ
jgi:hypothetical protein